MTTKVHRVRYYNPKPEAINCISFNKTTKLLAAARVEGSIEVWDLNYAPYLLKFIPGVEDGSVEALGWVGERLLSTGLGGALIEWDLEKLCLKTTVLLTGYAAWCLDVNTDNSLVAVGTEQGYLNLYSLENNDIVYKKLFDKQEGRILCCKFDKLGKVLITGSVDTIRVWNIETGHATSRISVSRRGKETIVWCLAPLSHNIVVSGDSHGKLTFWDTVMGDQIESYTTHKTDILSLVVTDDEKSLYCSGVDPVIVNFIKVQKGAGEASHWVKNVQRNIHEHDVRGLAMNGDQLISTGIDGYLTLSSYPPKWVMRIPPMIPMPRFSLSPHKKLLLLRYSNHLEVWKLGSYATNASGNIMLETSTVESADPQEPNNLEEDSALAIINKAQVENRQQNRSLKLIEHPVKLVSIQTKKNRQIRCCGMSPNGELIVYSTDSDVRMLKLDIDEDQTNISVSKLCVSGVTGGWSHVAFSEDSRSVAAWGGALRVVLLDPSAGATLAYTIPTEKYLKSSSLLHLHMSRRCGGVTYLAAADARGGVAVWSRAEGRFEPCAALPTYHCVPSALAFDTTRNSLIVSYVDQQVVEYSLSKKQARPWAPVPGEWAARRSAVSALAPRAAPGAALLAHDDTSLWLLHTNNTPKSTSDSADNEPTPKKKSHSKRSNSKTMPLKIIPIKYIAGFQWISDDEAVLIEMLPENIVAQLPSLGGQRNAA